MSTTNKCRRTASRNEKLEHKIEFGNNENKISVALMNNDGMIASDSILSFANLYLTDNKVFNNTAYSTIKNNVVQNNVAQIFFNLLIPLTSFKIHMLIIKSFFILVLNFLFSLQQHYYFNF